MKWGRPQIGFSTIYGTWSMCWWYTIDVAMRCHTLTGSKWLENIVNCWSSWSVELLQREAHQVWCSYTLPSLRDVHVLHGSYDSRVIIQPIIHITNPSDTNSNHSSSTAHGNISNIMEVESNISLVLLSARRLATHRIHISFHLILIFLKISINATNSIINTVTRNTRSYCSCTLQHRL